MLRDNIKRLRLQHNLILKQLALKADITYGLLLKLEYGKIKNPTLKTLKKLAKALNVSLDELTKE